MSNFIKKKIVVDSLEREYSIHHPDLKTIKTPFPNHKGSYSSYPVILAFHGGTDIESNRLNMTEWWNCVASHHVMGDEIIVICPKAEKSKNAKYKWNHAVPDSTDVPEEDLRFIETLLDIYFADPSKTFATGFSSGAGMVWQLLYQDRVINRFAGFGMVSQNPSIRKQELGDSAAMNTPKPIIYIHGTGDDNWVRTVNGGVEKMPPDTMRDLIIRNKTSEVPKSTTLLATDRNLAAIEQFFDSNSEIKTKTRTGDDLKVAPFAFITLLNTAHNWPRLGGNPPDRITTFSATAAIFNFWTKYAGLTVGNPPRSITIENC